MSEDGESRADRLRRRRSSKRDRSDEDQSVEPSHSSKPSELDEADERDEPNKQGEPSERGEQEQPSEGDKSDQPATETSVKEAQVGTYMYLPEPQHRRLNHVYNRLKADYEFEFESEFQKNRHFYPVLVQLGMEALEEASVEDVRERVEDLRGE